MFEGVDTVVLRNELAYHDTLPVRWEPLARPLDAFRLGTLEEANVLLLQACVAVEEHPLRDKNEDLHPLANELARLDFKLNLLLQMVGTLVNQAPASDAVPVQFNALGRVLAGARRGRRAVGSAGTAAHPPARRAGADARSVRRNHRQRGRGGEREIPQDAAGRGRADAAAVLPPAPQTGGWLA